MEKPENVQSESDSDAEFFDAADESPCVPSCHDKKKAGIDVGEQTKPQATLKDENEGLKLNLIQHFNHDTIACDDGQISLEGEHLEKVKNSSPVLYSGTTTLSPITECDSVEQFAREIDSDKPAVELDSSENNVEANNSSVTITHIESDQTKCLECKTVNDKDLSDVGSLILSGTSNVCNEVDIKSLDNATNSLSIEEDTPPPVAPPRRRRKKKSNSNSSKEQASPVDKNAPSLVEENPSSKQVQIQSPVNHQEEIFGQEQKNTGKTEIDLKLKLQSDPSIELDGNTQEMKEVLVKTSSTEVISALVLDSRLKSPSVSSLGSRSDLSDSFASVASNISNGHIRRSGSLTSVGSTHSYVGHTSNLVRVRSASGRPLSDTEILEQVMVRNLDTGELVPLSVAEEKLPECTNPLSLHIMKVTSEYSSNPDLAGQDQEDDVEVNKKISKKTKKLKKFFGKRVHKIRSEVKASNKQRGEDGSSSSEEEGPQQPNTPYIKIKSAHGKGPVEFEKLKLLQDLSGEHVGAVWTIKFSVCGRIMATAGQDNMVRVWILKEFQEYFEEMRRKYSRDGERSFPSSDAEAINTEDNSSQDASVENQEDDPGPFKKTPFCSYHGHTGDVLDLTWSKNYFLLSSSMDKTVRLWHISRNECLCCFQHIDFVTAIIFHPRDDRYFLSGSLDGKIRLWNIPDKKVALWNEIEGTGSQLITAANFVLNGKFAVVGTYDGRCIFYETERLKYHTQWQVRPSRNKKARGRKISGIEPMPGEEKVLITSNDSRIRLYDLKDNSLYCKYKGCANTSSQIKAGFSHDGQYIVCGSQDHFVYIWRTQHGIASSRRDKNDYFESFSAHEAAVTAAMFAPVPWLVVAPDASSEHVTSEVLVTADWTGAIKLFVNR